jgi:hypothetical protein
VLATCEVNRTARVAKLHNIKMYSGAAAVLVGCGTPSFGVGGERRLDMKNDDLLRFIN